MTAVSHQLHASTVAVVDDHEAVRTAVRVWCHEAQPAIQLAGEFSSATDFLTATNPLRGSIVIFGVTSADRRLDLSGLEEIVDAGHRVIVYSHFGSDEIVLQCIEMGAATCLAKSEGRHYVLGAIRAAHSVQPYIGPRMAAAMLNDQNIGRPRLSPREKQVLVAWLQTESKDIVAQRLQIAPATVRTLLQRVRAKYASVGRHAPTKSALVARAVQDGLVSLDEL